MGAAAGNPAELEAELTALLSSINTATATAGSLDRTHQRRDSRPRRRVAPGDGRAERLRGHVGARIEPFTGPPYSQSKLECYLADNVRRPYTREVIFSCPYPVQLVPERGRSAERIGDNCTMFRGDEFHESKATRSAH